MSLVVVPTSNNDERLAIQAVNQAMRIIDATRPKSWKVFLYRFGLTNAIKRMSQGIPDHSVDAP